MGSVYCKLKHENDALHLKYLHVCTYMFVQVILTLLPTIALEQPERLHSPGVEGLGKKSQKNSYIPDIPLGSHLHPTLTVRNDLNLDNTYSNLILGQTMS